MADKMKIPIKNPDGSLAHKLGTLLEVTDSNEPWAEYTLQDGTKIRIKQVLTSIVQLEGETDSHGHPIYSMQFQQATQIIPKIP